MGMSTLLARTPTWDVDRLEVDMFSYLPEFRQVDLGFYRVRAKSCEVQGSEPLPSELTACFSQALEDIRRTAQFLHGGRITSEQYAVRCQAIIKRFECLGTEALKEQKVPNTQVLLEQLKQRLKDEQQRATTHPPSRPQNPRP